MSNMSYCRFENTANDLTDCDEHMEDATLSEAEKAARLRLIRICCRIASDYEHEIEKTKKPKQ